MSNKNVFSRENLGPLIEKLPYSTIIRMCQTDKNALATCQSEPFYTMIQKKRQKLIQEVTDMPLDELKQLCQDGTKTCDFQFLRPILRERLPPKVRFFITIIAKKKNEEEDVPKEDLKHLDTQSVSEISRFMSVLFRYHYRYGRNLEWNLFRDDGGCIDDGDQVFCFFHVDMTLHNLYGEK